MSEWASRPRATPFAGRRKSTSAWCADCEALHRTHRAVGGPDVCPVRGPDVIERGSTPHVVAIKSIQPKPPPNRIVADAHGNPVVV